MRQQHRVASINARTRRINDALVVHCAGARPTPSAHIFHRPLLPARCDKCYLHFIATRVKRDPHPHRKGADFEPRSRGERISLSSTLLLIPPRLPRCDERYFHFLVSGTKREAQPFKKGPDYERSTEGERHLTHGS